jgi:hypothetical protein
MNQFEMAKTFTEVLANYQRLFKIEESKEYDGPLYSSIKDDDFMFKMHYSTYYRMWHVHWRYKIEDGPRNRPWFNGPQDHHGIRDCITIHEYSCYIEPGMERQALEDIRDDICSDYATDEDAEWSLANRTWYGITKSGVVKKETITPEMIAIIANDEDVDIYEVEAIIASNTCECGNVNKPRILEPTWKYCTICGKEREV